MLGFLDGPYRHVRLRTGADGSEGPAVVTGRVTGQGARAERGLFFIGGSVGVRRESAVVLFERENIEGQEVYAVGVLERRPDSRGDFSSYRHPPALSLLGDDAWVMDRASWTFYRAGAVGRTGYRLLGGLLALGAALRELFSDGRRAAATTGVSLLAVTMVLAMGISLWATPPLLHGARPAVLAGGVEPGDDGGSTYGLHEIFRSYPHYRSPAATAAPLLWPPLWPAGVKKADLPEEIVLWSAPLEDPEALGSEPHVRVVPAP